MPGSESMQRDEGPDPNYLGGIESDGGWVQTNVDTARYPFETELPADAEVFTRYYKQIGPVFAVTSGGVTEYYSLSSGKYKKRTM